MSFGYSVGDIITTGQLCWSVYRACKAAPGNYKNVTTELESLHINLKNLEDEVKNPKSLLNRCGDALRDEFNHILENVQTSLKDLERIVLKYRSLGTMERRAWDRARFGLKDLNTIRQKLTYHTAQIKLFLSTLTMSSLGRIESLLEDFIREIRGGRRARTLLSIDQGGDDAVVGWKQLESDLSEGGIPFEDIERHRDDIEEYLAQLIMGLELGSPSSPADFATGVPEGNWDSISQRMGASNEDARSQIEQSNVSKLDRVLPIKRKAENDHEVRNGRGRGFAPGLLHHNPINVIAAFGGLLQQQQVEEEEEEGKAISRLQQPPFAAPIPAFGQDGPPPALNSPAVAYLKQVKGRFADQPEVYKRFTDTLKDWENQAIDNAGLVERVLDLFAGHPDLIQTFRIFLRPGWDVHNDQNKNVVATQFRDKAPDRTTEQTFLERKDLETKLAVPERNSVTLLVEENERLKLQLQKAATENEILRATSAAHSHHRSLPPLDSHGPMRYSPTDLYTNVLLAPENETPSHTIMTSDTGERLFAAGST